MNQFYLSFFNLKSFYLRFVKRKWYACVCHGEQQGLDKMAFLRQQTGFSLLELVVVIALLSIVALASTSLIIDNGDLKRQNATEKRWDQLHDAIISQPNLYLNGSPYVRGYVADMGRLPVGVLELISQTPTYDHDDNDATAEILIPYDEDDNAATADITIDQPDWQDINLGYAPNGTHIATIQGGWRGPYLYTAGSRKFRDGWGGEEGDFEQDSVNFGWFFDNGGVAIAEAVDLFVRSYGSDQEPFGSGDFTEDFPIDVGQTIVSENEWTMSDAPISFNVNFSQVVPSPQTGLELRVYRYVDDGDNVADINDLLTINAGATFDLLGTETAAPLQTVTPDAAAPPFPGTPIGRFAALIWCTGIVPEQVYDGDCDSTINHSPVYFTLTNNTSQVTLTWNIP